ncbi:spermidine synthase [Limnohabitans sp. Rim8]|uniref:spermidine synthase n=1 Tax=Limnohabitans sp. Rim8 TaxID=1100718 RepID=UPI0025F9B582|nr:spermidine synthase [Limnohabitans sp. Rim8]
MTRKKSSSTSIELPEVNFSEDGKIRYLHLGTEWIQGSMFLDRPFDIELEYVQRMFGWLLFFPLSEVKGAHAMQLGLGAGTITKFCYKKLQMTCTAVELNPGVLHACRGWFRLPPDDERLRVVLADASLEIQKDEWRGTVDALQVDLYDEEAAAPVLDTPDFYRHCRELLSQQGCMTVNLFGRSSSYAESVEKICAAFGEDAVWAFKPTREGNAIVLAQRTAIRPSHDALLRTANAIDDTWGLPATKWLKVFKPICA